MSYFNIGQKIFDSKKNSGIVKYIGKTSLGSGVWIGIELDEPLGKYDGTIKSKKYFDCKKNHGTFEKESLLKKIMEKKMKSKSKKSLPSIKSTMDSLSSQKITELNQLLDSEMKEIENLKLEAQQILSKSQTKLENIKITQQKMEENVSKKEENQKLKQLKQNLKNERNKRKELNQKMQILQIDEVEMEKELQEFKENIIQNQLLTENQIEELISKDIQELKNNKDFINEKNNFEKSTQIEKQPKNILENNQKFSILKLLYAQMNIEKTKKIDLDIQEKLGELLNQLSIIEKKLNIYN
ncbi:protein nip100 [Anaeramoeba ignava]|uniref:Protein nip100 n=1 Tax=Anaeramoeba ignava TaxID=1746090 RepID=A0A9Q0LCQ3_ANAIG|nr:protein nip100 [Anaeramoeba ignava]